MGDIAELQYTSGSWPPDSASIFTGLLAAPKPITLAFFFAETDGVLYTWLIADSLKILDGLLCLSMIVDARIDLLKS